MALTTKQRAFVEAYLANGFNATKAALAAGYSERTAYSIGSENLTKPEIASLIQARIKAMAMSADEALARLSEMGRGDIGAFAEVGSAKALKEHPQSWLVKKVKRTRVIDGELPGGSIEEHLELELYNAQDALNNVLKEQHLRAGEATEIVDDAGLTDDERASRIAALLERARARRDGQADQSAEG